MDDSENFFPEEMPEGEQLSDAAAHDIRSALGASSGELPRVLEGEGYDIIKDCGGPGKLERKYLNSDKDEKE